MSIFKKLFLIFLGLLTAILALELILRLGGFIISVSRKQTDLLLSKETARYTIFTLGESTTAAETGNEPWPNQLEAMLNQRLPKKKFSVVNKALPGANSTILVSEFEKNLSLYKPDIVIAMMGVNDALHGQELNEGFLPTNIEPADLWFTQLIKNLKTYKLVRFLYTSLTRAQKSRDNTQWVPSYNLNPRKSLGGQSKKDNLPSSDKETELRLIEELRKNMDQTSFLELGHFYQNLGKFDKAENVFREAQLKFHTEPWPYIKLAQIYRDESRYKEANKVLGAYTGLYSTAESPDYYIQLGKIYQEIKNYSEAEITFKKALVSHPEFYQPYLALADFYAELGRTEEAEKMYKQYFSLTAKLSNNYNKLKEICKSTGIKLFAVQYPLVDALVLREMLENDPNVVYVSNKENFTAALEEASYEEFFTDRFAGDFGHATPKGNRLIAENVANAIIEEFFK